MRRRRKIKKNKTRKQRTSELGSHGDKLRTCCVLVAYQCLGPLFSQNMKKRTFVFSNVAYLLCTCCVQIVGSFFSKTMKTKTYIIIIECCVLVVDLLCTNCSSLKTKKRWNVKKWAYISKHTWKMLCTKSNVLCANSYVLCTNSYVLCTNVWILLFAENMNKRTAFILECCVLVVYQFMRVVYQLLNPLFCWKHEKAYRVYSRMLRTCCVPIRTCCVPICESSFLWKHEKCTVLLLDMLRTCCVPIRTWCVPIVESSFLCGNMKTNVPVMHPCFCKLKNAIETENDHTTTKGKSKNAEKQSAHRLNCGVCAKMRPCVYGFCE